MEAFLLEKNMKLLFLTLFSLFNYNSFAHELTGGYLKNHIGQEIRLGCIAHDSKGFCHKAQFLIGKDTRYEVINPNLTILLGKEKNIYQNRWSIFNWLRQRASTSISSFPYTKYFINRHKASTQFDSAFKLMEKHEELMRFEKTSNNNFKYLIEAIENYGREKIDDSDFSTPIEIRYFSGTDWFRPTRIKTREISPGSLGLKFLLQKANKTQIIKAGSIKLSIAGERVNFLVNQGTQSLQVCADNPGASVRGLLVFDNKHYRIMDRDVYELDFRFKCGQEATLIFDTDRREGQIMAIYDIVETAIQKFQHSSLLGFWKRQISIKWPGRGDFYSAGVVNVTKGDHWDVVGHELGHAIYDQARLGRMGGGQHYIDRCYNEALALSEGWASFFSAWLSIDLNHPDAQFEFMVPRRAPVKFENIPSDVCAGQTNEWRVTGFFWDLIDHHEDGEQSRISFSDYWTLHFDKRIRETKQFAHILKNAGYDPVLINLVWEKNFLTQL